MSPRTWSEMPLLTPAKRWYINVKRKKFINFTLHFMATLWNLLCLGAFTNGFWFHAPGDVQKFNCQPQKRIHEMWQYKFGHVSWIHLHYIVWIAFLSLISKIGQHTHNKCKNKQRWKVSKKRNTRVTKKSSVMTRRKKNQNVTVDIIDQLPKFFS